MVQFMNGQEYDGAAFYGLEGSIVQENNRGMMVRYDKSRKEVESWKVTDESATHMQNFLDCMRDANSRIRRSNWRIVCWSARIWRMNRSDRASG